MTTLAVRLDRLDKWLASLPGAPIWTACLIVKRRHLASGEDGGQILIAPAPQPAATYAVRLADLLRAGYPWINFNGAGIDDGRLLVGVDFPEATGVPTDKTSVNLSGPTRAVQE